MPLIKLHLSIDDTNNPAMMSLAFSVTILGSQFFFLTQPQLGHTHSYLSHFLILTLKVSLDKEHMGGSLLHPFRLKGYFPSHLPSCEVFCCKCSIL